MFTDFITFGALFAGVIGFAMFLVGAFGGFQGKLEVKTFVIVYGVTLMAYAGFLGFAVANI